MNVKCFFIEKTDRAVVEMRRYAGDLKCGGGGPFSYHNASLLTGEIVKVTLDANGCYNAFPDALKAPHDDPRWPAKCDQCDYRFVETDNWQVRQELLYFRIDTGEEMTLSDAPPGALWNADWMIERESTSNMWIGPDGMALHCKLPDGHVWHIDGQCSNCTMPDGFVHKCWVRTGDPRRPETLTVGKDGPTCAAGAGSILSPTGWHGFLRNGVLLSC